MDGVSIDVHGLKELEKSLLAIGSKLGANALRAALNAAGEPIRQAMIAGAPVGTVTRTVKGNVTITPGFLRSRIKKRSRINRKGAANKNFDEKTAAVVKIGVFKVPYVGAIEFGNSRNKAQPFIRPALMATKDQALAIFKTRLKKRIAAAEKKARAK